MSVVNLFFFFFPSKHGRCQQCVFNVFIFFPCSFHSLKNFLVDDCSSDDDFIEPKSTFRGTFVQFSFKNKPSTVILS